MRRGRLQQKRIVSEREMLGKKPQIVDAVRGAVAVATVLSENVPEAHRCAPICFETNDENSVPDSRQRRPDRRPQPAVVALREVSGAPGPADPPLAVRIRHWLPQRRQAVLRPVDAVKVRI